MPINGKDLKHSEILDLVKGICIILVCVTHYDFTMEERTLPIFTLLIDMAVSTFIIVMGYNFSASYKRKGINTISEAYKLEVIVPRILRVILPFLYFCGVELALDKLQYHRYGMRGLIEVVLPAGGIGAGSYFVPVTIQIIFIFPIVNMFVRKRRLFGLIILFICNALFEYFCVIYAMGEYCYRLHSLRYLFLLGIGTFMFWGVKESDERMVGRTAGGYE